MKIYSVLIITIPAFLAVHVQGQYIESLVPTSRIFHIDESLPDNDMWRRFETYFGRESRRLFSNDLHPLKNMQRQYRYREDFEGYRDRTDKAAIHALRKSFEHSAREAIADSPISSWLERQQDIPKVVAKFLRSIVSNPDEAELQATGTAFQEAERDWWNDVLRNRLRYGVELFRQNPYIYVGIRLGGKHEPTSLLSLRYYPLSFVQDGNLVDTAMKASLSYSLRPMKGYEIDVGTSYRFEEPDRSPGLAIKLYRQIGERGAFFIGANTRGNSPIFVGYGMRW